MTLSRRGLFGGVGLLLAAPAIIRPGLLMRVSAIVLPPAPLIYGDGFPSAMLTSTQIVREFAKLLRDKTEVRWPVVQGKLAQTHVEFGSSCQDLTLPMKEYSDRYLAPAALALSRGIGGVCVAPIRMETPADYDFAANWDARGLPVRMVHAYNIEEDRVRMRFDVLHHGGA